MSQARFRQIARLERLARPYLNQRQHIEKEWQKILWAVAAHAAILAFLLRYGDPKMGEPLSDACQRFHDSSAWKECCERFPVSLLDRKKEYSFEPYNRDRVFTVGTPLRHAVISNFPGADEKEKLNAVFSTAPPWLIWFTFGDYTAKLLGLTLPNLSDMIGFERSNFDIWWGLPTGAFECRPWPYGPDLELLARTDLALLQPSMESPVAHKSLRERRLEPALDLRSPALTHQSDWPHLPAPELLEMSFSERLAYLRRHGL
jgi:hypothetical protein